MLQLPSELPVMITLDKLQPTFTIPAYGGRLNDNLESDVEGKNNLYVDDAGAQACQNSRSVHNPVCHKGPRPNTALMRPMHA